MRKAKRVAGCATIWSITSAASIYNAPARQRDMRIKERRHGSIRFFFIMLLFANSGAAVAADPLPTWNDGPAKQSIIAFVEKVIKPGSTDFVPVAERIATFDNDGTLWGEQPVPVQLYFALDRVKELAPQHPDWKTKEPFASLLKGDLQTALAGGDHALYLAEDNSFDPRDAKLEGIGIMQWVQYYLDNYATVAEAVEAQKSWAFQIEPLILPNGYPTLVHISLSDKSGDSAVVEFIGGKAKIYHDKRFIVMTNEPTYDKQIENLKQYRTFGGDKALPGERTPTDRFVWAAYYANGLPKPANKDEAAAFMFSVIRNVSVPFGLGDPDRPNVASTIFRTLIDHTGGRYYFESTYAPNVVSVDTTKFDFSEGKPELELKVEKQIFALNGDVNSLLQPAKPLVFGMNKK